MNYLILVNKENKISDEFFNNLELIYITGALGEKLKVEKNTYEAYLHLKAFLEKQNIFIGIECAYRSVKEQIDILNEIKKEYGEDYASKYVALPYTSEHHTGLAIDLTLKIYGKFLDDNDCLFDNNETFMKIHKHLHKFGFILRYPKGKELITGYDYEPWHIRYVGKCAKVIYENNITLEEYVHNFIHSK